MTSTIPESLNLTKVRTVSWNLQKRFDAYVNTDVAQTRKIVFKYEAGVHDVMLMASQVTFDTCDFAGATQVDANGIDIEKGGFYFFASSKAKDCATGLKQAYKIYPLENLAPANATLKPAAY